MHHGTPSPTGYGGLGLGWDGTPPTSGRAAAAAVRAFEAKRGGRCTVRGFDRLDAPVAAELAAVYRALRVAWPTVAADRLAVTRLATDVLGQAWLYRDEWPAAHRYLRQRQHLPAHRRLAVTAVTGGRDLAAAVRRGDVVDPTRTGTIELGGWVASDTGRRSAAAYWNRSDAAHRRWGSTPRSAPTAVSVQAAVLIHEFGHLAEAELLSLGEEATLAVYGTLSAAVHGLGRAPGARSPRHLGSFPLEEAPTGACGAVAVRALLGDYATTDRSELFAEAFLHAHAAADEDLRRRLAPFRRRLARALGGRR